MCSLWCWGPDLFAMHYSHLHLMEIMMLLLQVADLNALFELGKVYHDHYSNNLHYATQSSSLPTHPLPREKSLFFSI
jgi:hypothetical protein